MEFTSSAGNEVRFLDSIGHREKRLIFKWKLNIPAIVWMPIKSN